MTIKEKDIVYESAPYWVLQIKNGHYEVYKDGVTHSTRCSQIGWKGKKGLDKAIAEINRRMIEDYLNA